MAGIDNNTVLYLRGDSFNDLSPNLKSITNTGVVITDSGIFGKSYRFVGNTSSYFDCNIGGLSDNFTIEFFFKVENLSNVPHLFSYGKSATNRIICAIESNVLKFVIYNGTSNVITFTGLDFNQYNHVSIVSVNNKIKVSINGKFSSTEIDASLLDKTYPTIRFGRTIYYSDGKFGLLGNIFNIRISNVARYTENFTPPTQLYNSITINKTNQTDTNIEFNIEKLGQETINKVEVLVNGTVSETYSDNYDSINYLIDTELCVLGNNDITIRVTYDDTYTEELSLTHNVTVNPLPLETPLLDTVERVKLLTKSKQNEKTMLSSILTSKNVEVSEEDKMSDLIGKVDLLGKYDDSKLWLYKEGSDTASVESYWGNRLQYGTSWWYGPQTKGTIYSDRFVCEVSQKRSIQTITTTSKVDLSKYNKLYFECKVDEYTPNVGSTVGILATNNIIEEPSSWILSKYYINTTTSRNKYFIDISNINTSAYISTLALNNDSASKTKISFYNIWLDK